MYAIMELSGQEYVDMYAPAAKEAAAREARAQEADEVSPAGAAPCSRGHGECVDLAGASGLRFRELLRIMIRSPQAGSARRTR